MSIAAPSNSDSGTKVRVFSLTWLSYASYYLGRKGFSIVKSHLSDHYGVTKAQLGYIDTGYLAAYSLGQFVMGLLGDRIGSRRLLGLGMIAVAISVTFFGLMKTAVLFFVFYAMNGFFQASGWPGNVKAMGSWFSATERGKIMGAWSTCYQVGGLVASAVATWALTRYGWRSAFFIPAAWIAFVGVMLLLFLPERSTASNEQPIKPTSTLPATMAASEKADPWQLYRNPVIWSLGAAYFCLKLIRYSILFWFPYYMTKVLGYSEKSSGYQSVSFEIGGVFGSIIIGWVSDKYFPGRRRILAAIMTFALALALFTYLHVSHISMVANFVGMALVGFCLFGPDTLICGSAAQDIGGKHNVAKAAGFINGVGSVGAIFQGLVTTKVSDLYGWTNLFYVFVGMSVLSSIVLLAIGFGRNEAAPVGDS